ncbi:hypothetical protein [Aliikangiella sp. IMCC44359]|uniref:hypothetical protein n=1 Tax=Aliikangiella sp. IMCC44359 TaxID=3459125 RepID=UPI00403AF88F
MSFWGVVIGSAGQAILAFFLFMLVAFAGGGAVNGRSKSIGEFSLSILNLSIYLLPLSCVISAGIVIYSYSFGYTSSYFYYCYVIPLVLALFYGFFVSRV